MTKPKTEKPELKRPLDPVTGAIVFLGPIVVTAGVALILQRTLPFDPESLARLRFPLTSDGAWLMLSAWLLYPWVSLAAFHKYAKGVDAMQLTYAFAGVTYFLQCYAEYAARDVIAGWPELLFTATPTLVFHKIMKKHEPPGS
jgi:hypothetical protein